MKIGDKAQLRVNIKNISDFGRNVKVEFRGTPVGNLTAWVLAADIVHVETPPLKVGDLVEGLDREEKRIVAIVGCHAWITTLDGDKEPYKCGLASLVGAERGTCRNQ